MVEPTWTMAAGELIWRSWQVGEFVVYHTASGSTHLLNDFAAEILRSLDHNPMTLAELAERLSETAGCQLDNEMIEQTQAVLSEFEVLGLVESHP